jgi:hypothetical protein
MVFLISLEVKNRFDVGVTLSDSRTDTGTVP